jgi:hypothetical protein
MPVAVDVGAGGANVPGVSVLVEAVADSHLPSVAQIRPVAQSASFVHPAGGAAALQWRMPAAKRRKRTIRGAICVRSDAGGCSRKISHGRRGMVAAQPGIRFPRA